MSTLETHEPRSHRPEGRTASVFLEALLLSHAVLTSRGTIALLALVVGIALCASALLPLGIATSPARLDEIGPELHLLLFGCVALLVLLRMTRWGPVIRGLGPAERACIAMLSICYLHALLSILDSIPEWVFFHGTLGAGSREVGESLWLSGLAGILGLARLAPRMLGLTFLLLAWWVPVLGMLGQANAVALAKGLSHAAGSAEGVLPMLVPHLLAVGCVCLERAQR